MFKDLFKIYKGVLKINRKINKLNLDIGKMIDMLLKGNIWFDFNYVIFNKDKDMYIF